MRSDTRLHNRHTHWHAHAHTHGLLPTNQRHQGFFHDAGKLVIDVNGEVTENLSVLRQIKILQGVLVLPWGVVLHEVLRRTQPAKARISYLPQQMHQHIICFPLVTYVPMEFVCCTMTYLLPAVLLQRVEHVVGVGKPEWQHLKIFLVFLKKRVHDILENILLSQIR